ncbi:MAG: hypothetical protein BWY09_01684 [Candidatus Hydrogenedentes bacterium ADurb.Bin179]|nr:MAG: hypothetical protein BWY09_01684 [Candidatus Hydrogenedentes bacterium ADurb.Bin179]
MSGSTTDAVPTRQGENGWDHTGTFFIELNGLGEMVAGGGSGYDGGSWYYYPNTDWWNEWYYDGVLDLTQTKNVLLMVNIMPTMPGNDVTVAVNYSSGAYPPGSGQPPIRLCQEVSVKWFFW